MNLIFVSESNLALQNKYHWAMHIVEYRIIEVPPHVYLREALRAASWKRWLGLSAKRCELKVLTRSEREALRAGNIDCVWARGATSWKCWLDLRAKRDELRARKMAIFRVPSGGGTSINLLLFLTPHTCDAKKKGDPDLSKKKSRMNPVVDSFDSI